MRDPSQPCERPRGALGGAVSESTIRAVEERIGFLLFKEI